MPTPDPTALAVAAGRAIETSRVDGLIFEPYARAFIEQAGAALPVIWPNEVAGRAGKRL